MRTDGVRSGGVRTEGVRSEGVRTEGEMCFQTPGAVPDIPLTEFGSLGREITAVTQTISSEQLCDSLAGTLQVLRPTHTERA